MAEMHADQLMVRRAYLPDLQLRVRGEDASIAHNALPDAVCQGQIARGDMAHNLMPRATFHGFNVPGVNLQRTVIAHATGVLNAPGLHIEEGDVSHATFGPGTDLTNGGWSDSRRVGFHPSPDMILGAHDLDDRGKALIQASPRKPRREVGGLAPLPERRTTGVAGRVVAEGSTRPLETGKPPVEQVNEGVS